MRTVKLLFQTLERTRKHLFSGVVLRGGDYTSEQSEPQIYLRVLVFKQTVHL